MLRRAIDVATSCVASAARLTAGMYVRNPAREPRELLELYEFEGCPWCRRVREALTELDLNALIHPCPKKGRRFRAEAERRGVRHYPLLVDRNTGVQLDESSEILTYLLETYGGSVTPVLLTAPLAGITGSLASAMRWKRGRRARASRPPQQPLVLYSFEASPYCRLAREALCDLEIPYQLINCGHGSRHRQEFVEMSGRMMFPYLVDPNTDTEMFESAEIVKYLEQIYAE